MASLAISHNKQIEDSAKQEAWNPLHVELPVLVIGCGDFAFFRRIFHPFKLLYIISRLIEDYLCKFFLF